jgi:hypothetical protein
MGVCTYNNITFTFLKLPYAFKTPLTKMNVDLNIRNLIVMDKDKIMVVMNAFGSKLSRHVRGMRTESLSVNKGMQCECIHRRSLCRGCLPTF